MSVPDRRAMLDREHAQLSIRRQCDLLGIARSGVYRPLRPANDLWRSLKYEDIYLKGYADGREAKLGIAQWVAFYNTRRPHMALDHRTPMAVWRDGIGGLDGTAVDMSLRMDNAHALPTCPQPQQPQMMIA